MSTTDDQVENYLGVPIPAFDERMAIEFQLDEGFEELEGPEGAVRIDPD